MRTYHRHTDGRRYGHSGSQYQLVCLTLQSTLAFCLLLNISWGNPCLKILDLANLYVADAPMKKKIKTFIFIPSQSTLKNWSKNRPCSEGLKSTCTCFHCLPKTINARLKFKSNGTTAFHACRLRGGVISDSRPRYLY